MIKDTEEAQSFNVHLDSVNGEPALILTVSRIDNSFPLISDSETKPHAAIQETLLRFMGVLIDLFQDNPTFKEAAAKWGIAFRVDSGLPPVTENNVAP